MLILILVLVLQTTEEESHWSKVRAQWLAPKSKRSQAAATGAMAKAAQTPLTSSPSGSMYVTAFSSGNAALLSGNTTPASPSPPSPMSSQPSSSAYQMVYSTSNSPAKPAKPAELTEDDFDLLYCDLTERNGRLSKRVPLSALSGMLSEIWEDSGLFDNLEDSQE